MDKGAGRKPRYVYVHKGGVNPLHREATNSYVGPSFNPRLDCEFWDAMTTWEARSSQPPLTSDIGVFVAKYQRLVDHLSPFTAAGNAVLYVVRWRNYLLTLVVLVALSVLMYYPALLLGCVTLSAIVGMGLGRYYKQTHIRSLAKLKQPPSVEHLNQDQQIIMRHRKEQKNSRKTLVEYRNIMQSAEHFMVVATETLQYVNSIIFWKSPEVSLCVTVLLCVVFVLVCAVPLRTIASCLPVLALCSNRHFFKRTVDMWTIIWNAAYTRLKVLKWKRRKDNKQPTVENTQPRDGSAEEADNLASARSTATMQNHTAKNGTSTDSDDTKKGDSRDSAQPSSAQDGSSPIGVSENNTAAGTAATGKGSAFPPNKKELLKGFCTKCSASFAKLLKRKHDCNYCGQSFCGSCTVKVKRALLGATSPAAFEESVRVCVDCKEKLDNLATHQPASVS